MRGSRCAALAAAEVLRDSLMPREKRAAQAESPGEAPVYTPLGYAKRGCDLMSGPAKDVSHHKDGPKVRTQLDDCRCDLFVCQHGAAPPIEHTPEPRLGGHRLKTVRAGVREPGGCPRLVLAPQSGRCLLYLRRDSSQAAKAAAMGLLGGMGAARQPCK